MNSDEARRIAEQAQTYLQKKYNQDFQIISLIDKSIDVPYEEIHLCPATNPEDMVTVYHSQELNDENFYFSDNYYRIIVRDEFEKKIHSIIDSRFDRCKIFFGFTASFFPDELDASFSLDDALEKYSDALFVNIFVFIPEENAHAVDSTWKDIWNDYQANRIACYFAFYGLNDTDFHLMDGEAFKHFWSINHAARPIIAKTVGKIGG